MAVYRLGDAEPRLAEGAWVADSASVVGRVSLGTLASVWFGAVVRGDNEWIVIGDGSNVQDGAVLHTDIGSPLTIGRNVTVGHQVTLHGCILGDGSLIGIQSIVLNGARIGRHTLVGAGSLVTEGKAFPDGVLVMGRPAKVVRELTPDQITALDKAARGYMDKARRYASTLAKVGA